MRRNLRRSRANIAKGECRANGTSANWHDRAVLYALRRSANIAKVSLFLKDFLQPFDIAEYDFPTFDFDKALGGEILEHAGDDFAGGIHVASDFFLGFLDFWLACALVGVNEVSGEALVEFFEEHLLDCPNRLRITFRLLFKDK